MLNFYGKLIGRMRNRMNKKIEKLLSVISMSDEEQYSFLSNYFTEKHFKTDEWPKWYGVCDILIHGDSSERRTILADTAFSLRDELHDPLGSCAWDRACWEVWKYYHTQQGNNIFERKHLSLDTRERYCFHWMIFWAEPIHWIIASLITKEIVADEDEKFDAHLTEADFEGEEQTNCNMCGGISGKHNQIDDLMAGNSHMLTKMQCPNDINEKRPLSYGIAQHNGENSFGFWDGPNPSLEEMLEVDGRDEDSVIWRFNEDGTDDLIYRWCCSEWMKIVEG